MARELLDFAWENTSAGTKIYAVFFNDVTKQVEADFVKNFNVLDNDFVDFPQEFAFGNKMYDECFGPDRYEVIKRQSFPFGDVVLTVNSPVCATQVINTVLYRFDTGPSGPLGDDVVDVCGFDGSAYLYFVGALELGSVVYTDSEASVPLPYNGNGWFLIGTSAYRINSSSEIIDIQASYCEIVEPLPDPDPLPDLDFGPFLHLPQATAIRFIKNQVNTYQTQDNTLLANQYFPGIIMQRFEQVVKKGEDVTIQFGSSYGTNSVKIYDLTDDSLVATITPTKVLENLNQEIEVPGFAVSDPSIVGIQIYFPNYPFPDFAFAGNKVNIQGTQVSGQFNVSGVQEGRGSAKGNRVLIADFTINQPAPVAVTVSGKYNAEPYEVYEAVISLNTNGRYYAVIECTDAEFDAVSARSEPFRVTDLLDEYLEVNYTNENDEYGCYYGNELVHRLWIKSRLFDTFPGGEKTINRETSAKLVKLDEFITKSLQWKMFGLPPYLVTQISIALSHDQFSINGVDYQTEDVPEPEYYPAHNLANMQVRLEEVEFTERNREGGTIDSSDSFLTIQNAGNRLLINP
jgi:hypothetical protein